MDGHSAPEGWTEEQARAVVRLGFTFPYRGHSGPGAVAVRGKHHVAPSGQAGFVAWASSWAPGLEFPTPEAAIVWADVEGWGAGKLPAEYIPDGTGVW